MILHLLTDEKFTDYAIAQFSAPEMESDFVLIPSNNVMHLVKHIDRCTVIGQYSPEFEDLLNRLDQYTGIVLHGLLWARWQTPILERVPKSVKVAWYVFGGEIYSRKDIELTFAAPFTKFVYRLHTMKKNEIEQDRSWQIPIDLYKRINYCMTSIREEADYARQYTGASFKHQWYTCYSLEDTIGALMTEQCHGNNIWIGNSAAEWNNHIDAFWQIWKSGALRKHNFDKVIIPLSYGAPWIRNVVTKVGRFFFGKRMQALVSFMPREEYNTLMLSCSTMIINYYEPAANGNIITALWLGMRVYLSEKSMAYIYYKRIGAKVFTLEKDLKIYGFAPLSDEERAENRKVLNQWYSKEHVEQAVKEVVNELR